MSQLSTFIRAHCRRLVTASVRRQFRRHVAVLLDRFETAMASSGEPEGLTWQAIEPSDSPIAIAIPNDPAATTVLQPIEVRFAAIRDGGMEDAPGLKTIRAAIAMFHHDGRDWSIGRCLFNVDVNDVAEHLRSGGGRAD